MNNLEKLIDQKWLPVKKGNCMKDDEGNIVSAYWKIDTYFYSAELDQREGFVNLTRIDKDNNSVMWVITPHEPGETT